MYVKPLHLANDESNSTDHCTIGMEILLVLKLRIVMAVYSIMLFMAVT